MSRHFTMAVSTVMLSHAPAVTAPCEEKQHTATYTVTIDTAYPYEAEVRLRTRAATTRLLPARGAESFELRDIRCADGRPATSIGSAWQIPDACADVSWTIRLRDLDEKGLDASAPRSAFSQQQRYWVLVERDLLLRASDAGGHVAIRLTANGRTMATKSLRYPTISEPPFIGAISERVGDPIRHHGMQITHFGPRPRYRWIDAIDDRVLAAWSRWRRDLQYREAPRRIDWIWVGTTEDADPGFTASAGTEAILAQLKSRPDDPDFEAKARVVYMTTAMHEGFHVISGSHAHGWPAWVNESLASYFAIEASSRLINGSDRIWLDRFFLSPRTGTPLIEAQRRYAEGAVDQGAAFYADGPAFWREIEAVLTTAPNPSGRLAALLAASNGFDGVDLTDAAALAKFLDRYSNGSARPIVERYLTGNVAAPRLRQGALQPST